MTVRNPTSEKVSSSRMGSVTACGIQARDAGSEALQGSGLRMQPATPARHPSAAAGWLRGRASSHSESFRITDWPPARSRSMQRLRAILRHTMHELRPTLTQAWPRQAMADTHNFCLDTSRHNFGLLGLACWPPNLKQMCNLHWLRAPFFHHTLNKPNAGLASTASHCSPQTGPSLSFAA